MTTTEQELADHTFFAGLDGDALRLLAGCAVYAGFRGDDYVFKEGEPADRFYVIRHGRIAIEVQGPGVGRMVIDTVEDGDILGWSWLVPPYRWLFDARAVEPTTAVCLDGKCLRDKCEADPRLGYQLMSRVALVMTRRLTAARVRLLDLYGHQGLGEHSGPVH
jgi:CRP-like cAMP-binding protein